jgi:hypothetical protein
MAAAAITPRSFETFFMPANFPGVSFMAKPPRAEFARYEICICDCREWLVRESMDASILNEGR